MRSDLGMSEQPDLSVHCREPESGVFVVGGMDLDLDAVRHGCFGDDGFAFGPVVLMISVAAFGRCERLAPDDLAVLVEDLKLALETGRAVFKRPLELERIVDKSTASAGAGPTGPE